MFRALYDWTLRLAQHRHAMRSMAAVSFAESSFFPIPPDVMLVPMMLARRHQIWLIATVCTLASVAGAVFGYAIGYFLYETVGNWLINLYGLQEAAVEFRAEYERWGAAIILVLGITPIPYKLATIASGVAHFNLPLFILVSIIARGFRFFLLAGLIHLFGPPIQSFVEKRVNLLGTLFVILLIGGFAVVSLV